MAGRNAGRTAGAGDAGRMTCNRDEMVSFPDAALDYEFVIRSMGIPGALDRHPCKHPLNG